MSRERKNRDISKLSTFHARLEMMLRADGRSDNAISEAMGVSRDFVRDLFRKKTIPGAANLQKLALTLGTSSDYLLGPENALARGQEIEYSPAARPAPLPDLKSPARDFRGPPAGLQPPLRDLPIYGSALGSSQNFDHGAPVETHLVEMGQTIDHVRRPPGLAHPESYALYVVGDSQSPRFEPGDLIYINPRRPAAPGDDVVVQLRDELTGEVATALIKRLVRRTASTVTLRQFNPPRDFDVRTSLVHAIHRVMPLADLLGS